MLQRPIIQRYADKGIQCVSCKAAPPVTFDAFDTRKFSLTAGSAYWQDKDDLHQHQDVAEPLMVVCKGPFPQCSVCQMPVVSVDDCLHFYPLIGECIKVTVITHAGTAMSLKFEGFLNYYYSFLRVELLIGSW